MRLGWLNSKYLVLSVLPYFLFSWILLSVILFVQQASRFSDIFFSANIPTSLVWQLSFALVPNVIAFTCPMAALVGVIIGLTKMQSDSELVAIRAAGVGNFGITLPMVLLGVVLTGFALLVNLKGVPLASGIVRRVAMQTALHELESPIEPGVFNTEVAGFTIYVKGGDLETGRWKNIFIFNEDPASGTVRLVTSASGRIDYTNEDSELVLENAVSSTISGSGDRRKFFSESVGELRYAVKTRRSEIIERMNKAELSPEELGLEQLSEYARSREGAERTEAELLWYRRILLSVSPLIFCIFGSVFVLRFNRKGRGFAVFSALAGLVAYYLLAFLGEQLARSGWIGVRSAGLLPIVASGVVILWLALAGRFSLAGRLTDFIRDRAGSADLWNRRPRMGNLFVDVTTGLRDFDIAFNLIKFYLLSVGFLTAIFFIFTAFELWRFAGTMDGGPVLLVKYLFYLLPFVYLQLSPSSAMIATLATYVIKSRQNEIVTWTSAGQSVYRLLLPCLFFMAALGFVNWQVQERVAPLANRVQDSLRIEIRARGKRPEKPERYWVASERRILSFKLGRDGGNGAALAACHQTCPLSDLSIYEFADDGTNLRAVYSIPSASWQRERIVIEGTAELLELAESKIVARTVEGGEIQVESNPFIEIRTKPAHLNSAETRAQIEFSGSAAEERSFSVALQRKYSTPFLPLLIGIFTAPFALSLSRKGKAATTGYAIGLWLAFMGATSVFEQLGLNGTLPPAVAVWGPLAVFAAIGIFLLSRIRT
ncbi:MAG: LptF/LptG family permease [Chloracidobacterium sp.]|nr:LptF/LptG family permease [Chloracidobacterium sp.]